MTLPQSQSIPRLYPILDAGILPAQPEARAEFLSHLGRELAATDLTLLEYRNKRDSDAQVFADALLLRTLLPAGRVRLVLDDRVDVALAAAFDGVHVDAGDLPPQAARALLGTERIVGTSASSASALTAALAQPVDYVSFGPIFPTTTKQTDVAPIGMEGVRRFRALAGAGAVLVAAAGITLDTAPAILAAGASAVAVSAAIFHAENPAAEIRKWLKVLV